MEDKSKVNRDLIRAALVKAGIYPGDVILAHCSLSSFGAVEGGADTIIDALLGAVGREGTLIVPTHTWDRVNLDSPVFDVKETGSCVGAVSNAILARRAARRSLHPTHSCAAVGPEKRRFLDEHEKDLTPCGFHSPYRRLLEWGGRIAFLGTGLACNTTLHAIEEIVRAPYLFSRFHDLYAINRRGRKVHVPSLRHAGGLPRRFGELGPVMEQNGIMRRSVAAGASIEVVDARGMMEAFLPLAARDRFYLLSDEAAPQMREWYERRPAVPRRRSPA